MKAIKTVIKERMTERLKTVFSAIAICLSYDYDSYFVAGNSCNAAVPHDFDNFDIYPRGTTFDFSGIKSRIESVGGYVVTETRNALTVIISGKFIQFCNYSKPDLISLIESFDFAHIQIGVAVEIEWEPGDPEDGGGYSSSTIRYVEFTDNWQRTISHVEFTDNWQRALMLETTWYTGSDYPLSSLLRATKYFQRGAYVRKRDYKKDVLNIMNDIISRGYKDYKDYKDQLAAIDLPLLEPEEKEAVWNLWKTCGHHGLVKNFDPDWNGDYDDDM